MRDKLIQNCRKPKGLGGKMVLKGMNSHHAQLAAWAMSNINLPKDARILDVGCGGGANIAELIKMCPNGFVDGIDYSDTSVAMSKKTNSKTLGKHCAVTLGDVSNLPYKDGLFDSVTAFETIYFWPDLEKAFTEIYRVLKPNGCFMIVCEDSDPTDTTWTNRIDGMKIYSENDLQERLKKIGFSSFSIDKANDKWLCLIALR